MILYFMSCDEGMVNGNTKIVEFVEVEGEQHCENRKFVQIETALSVVCYLDNCGKLSCMGEVNPFDSSNYPDILTGVYKDFELMNGVDSAFAPYDVSGCAIDLEGIAHCWQTEGYDSYLEDIEGEQVDFLSLSFQQNCLVRNFGTPFCSGYYLNEEIYDYQWKTLSVSQHLFAGITYDGIFGAFSHNAVYSDEQYNVVDSFQTRVCASNDDYVICWWEQVPLLFENALYIDYEHPGTQMCGYYDPCILQHDGSVWCSSGEGALVYDEPLVSLTCGYTYYPQSELIVCGLTAAGEGRCWQASRGYWAILP